jgi:hypothetical protein
VQRATSDFAGYGLPHQGRLDAAAYQSGGFPLAHHPRHRTPKGIADLALFPEEVAYQASLVQH